MGWRIATVAGGVAVVAALVVIAVTLLRIADETDSANCIARAEATTPVVVVPVEPKGLSFDDDRGRIAGRNSRIDAVDDC